MQRSESGGWLTSSWDELGLGRGYPAGTCLAGTRFWRCDSGCLVGGNGGGGPRPGVVAVVHHGELGILNPYYVVLGAGIVLA